MKSRSVILIECRKCHLQHRIRKGAEIPQACVGCRSVDLHKIFAGFDDEDADNDLPRSSVLQRRMKD